jgi:CYTH domain-containing protein
VWEIDEFEDDNRGLITAEVELKDEHQLVTLPGWLGQEVTGDPRYFNSNLVANPFSKW